MKLLAASPVRGIMIVFLAWIALLVPTSALGEDLDVMIWETDELNTDELFETINEFTREHLVSVRLLSVTLREYPAQLAGRLAGGDAPDLFWVTGDLLLKLAQDGLIIPLDSALRGTPGLLVSRQYQVDGRQLGLQVGPSKPFSDVAYAVSRSGASKVELAVQFVGYIQQRWSVICCAQFVQPNPPPNTAIAAHGNTDWHIDTANEFLFGTDMNGATTASNHCPSSWTRTHIHVGLTNTNHFYYDRDQITPGDDTDATSGIDTAMLFFYAGHGFPPSTWDTLGNSASVSNVSIGDDPGWGRLRYYWQCSCTVFAHGPNCCAGDSCSSWHPCPSGQDWWYQCPGEFTGAADSLTTPNVYERWGAAISPNLRMACGSSTCAYCHEGQVSRIWNDYSNLGYDVADSFIDGLRAGSVVPLCISMGGYNVNLNPLVADTSFTNLPNTSGTSHYYVQYLSNFASSQVSGTLKLELPEFLPKQLIVRPGPIPRQWLDEEFRIDKEWIYSPDDIDGRGPRVRINQLSGAMYLAGPSRPAGEPPLLSEQGYFDQAWRYMDELGWQEELADGPSGVRMMIAAAPVEKPAEQEHFQKNVIVTFKRLVDVEGQVVPVLGEGGVIEVQMNNDGTLLNASKVWREVVGTGQWEPVKPYERALNEALDQTKAPWAYGLVEWEWGYVEAAGNEAQDAMRLVYRFSLTPKDAEDLRELPPLLIEIAA